MDCKEKSCKGKIILDPDYTVAVKVCSGNIKLAFPCENCGRLHLENGNAAIRQRDNRRVFFKNDKLIFRKPHEDD